MSNSNIVMIEKFAEHFKTIGHSTNVGLTTTIIYLRYCKRKGEKQKTTIFIIVYCVTFKRTHIHIRYDAIRMRLPSKYFNDIRQWKRCTCSKTLQSLKS